MSAHFQSNPKKMAAALAAVELYLEAERASSVNCAPAQSPIHDYSVEPSAWSQTGRMDMMGMRRLLQLRAFPALR